MSSVEPHELPLRTITRVYMAALVVAAASCLVSALVAAPMPDRVDWLALLGFAAAATVAIARPLRLAYQVQFGLDTVALIAALLLIEPGFVMVVAIGAGIGANLILKRTWPEVIFNAAQLTLQVAAGALVLSMLGWDVGREDFNSALPVIATILAGTAMYLVNTIAVAGMICFQDRIPLLDIWMEMTLRSNPAELLSYGAQLGLGLLGAVIADSAPWALALLLIPAVAVYVSLDQHIEMRRRAEENLEAAQRLVQLGSWDWNLISNEQHWSAELHHLLGLNPKEARPGVESYLSVIPTTERDTVARAIDRATHAGEEYALDHTIIPGDGSGMRIVHARGQVVRAQNGEPKRFVATIHDISERKRLEQQLEHLAYHDPLTDLPNRALFTRRISQVLDEAGRRARIAVLFLDLDRFKLINDTFGHEAGDALLQTVAERLRACVRPGDMVARMGGDEFTILLLNVAAESEAIRVAERIIARVTEPIPLPGNREAFISTSIGIVRPGLEHQRGGDLLRDADNALYRAKERGRNRYVLFDAQMRAETERRVELESDLRYAIERDELRLLYQPKIDLGTGRTVAVEVFARWQHPTQGIVAPGAFIPIAEETGLIAEIGRWVFEEACGDAVAWARVVDDPPVLSVNLSGKQLHDPDLVSELEEVLRVSGLPPQRLRLEISEGVAMQNADATGEALERLQERGVRVVIDDFGTGYSSLISLQRFAVDTLQLDHSFVAHLGRNRQATTIARAVIGLAHGLGLQVMAEGVERQEQLDLLRALGCEQAQGNYFTVPLASDELAAFLRRPAFPLPAMPTGVEPAPSVAGV